MRFSSLFVAVFSASLLPAEVPGPFFDEYFDTGDENPALEGYQNFRIDEGTIHRTTETADDQSRQYLRTVRADYNTLDFVYEVTYHTAAGTINFVGIGQADPTAAYNEPSAAVTLRLHSPDVIEGAVKLNLLGETNLGKIGTPGPHRVRLEKRGAAVTFSIDVDFSGSFSPDITQVIPDLQAAAPFLTGTSSRLFFGSARIRTTFDDLSVYPPFGQEPFRRGDSDGDGQLTINDPVQMLGHLFLGGSLKCQDAADVSDDGAIDLGDPVGLLGFLFLGTLKPPPPFPACGQDSTGDRLSCEFAGACL